MVHARLLCLATVSYGIRSALSQSAKSCGASTDHLKNVGIQVTPDPPVKGQPFTIDVTGSLDEALTAGAVNLNLDITTLGIIHSSVSGKMPFTYAPGLPKGDTKIKIGPSKLPSTPGSTKAKGQVHIVDGKGDAVACVELDLKIGATDEPTFEGNSDNVTTPSLGSVTSCTKDADHMKHFSLTESGTVLTAKGDLDEDIDTLTLDLDFKISKLFIHVPVKTQLPITLSPSIPKGPFTLGIGPADLSFSPDPKVGVKGSVVMGDAKNEEVFCLNVNEVVEDSDIIV